MERATAKSVYTTHQISRLLHVNPRSVINWIEQDLLASYRTPGGHRRIRHEDLLAFLRKHQMPTPAALMDGRFNVLIVDDENDVVGLIRTGLERDGVYSIRSASDGITAMIELGRNKPDLMILNVMIPGIDGVEVCRRVKADPDNRTAVVATGGCAETGSEAIQAGADAFVAKPLDVDKLIAEARKLLSTL